MMDFMELSKDTTRFRNEFQYLKKFYKYLLKLLQMSSLQVYLYF